MRKTIVLITASLLGASLPIIADPSTPSQPGNNILKENKDKQNRPNSLVEDVIICMISNNLISFELPQGVESISISIYNDTEGWIGFATREDNWVETPFTSGCFNIDCFTPDGRTFSGVISFDQ